MPLPLRAPFPWFGGKSRVAHLVWGAFGADIANYIEPFAGSLAVLLARPGEPRVETVNDLDCYLSNFWRALKLAPEEVAKWAEWPVSEIDLHARHRWLVEQAEFRERMRADPHFFDAKVAGWWVWGLCQWIGGGWCAESNWGGSGSKTARERRRPALGASNGVHRKRPSLARGGKGVHRTTADWQVPPQLGGSRGASGNGIHASGLAKKLVKLDRGTDSRLNAPVLEWMQALSERLRRVRICNGDWKRVLSPSATTHIGVTGVLLDPPYLADFRDASLYGTESPDVAHAVREWALKHGDNPKFRIALCGYEGEHQMPKSWQCVAWKAAGGYAAAAGNPENSTLERIWFSPHCERAYDQSSFGF